ncbi:MAG: GntR family transcriptional regulator [Deltaproteobacteria bacterium]|nr:GntR family transcriptional regulator [Deltaproteobacteria bacterium]
MQLSVKINKNKTLRESIADVLRNSIMQGELKPGVKISEPAYARQFGISRTPVREAFRQLDSEGFLQVLPRRGARVAPLSEKDVREFYEIKAELESYAARLAAPRLTPKDIDRMENLNDQMEKCHLQKDYKKVFNLHNEFHEVFIKACGNEQLHQLLKMLANKFQRFRILLTIAGKSEGSIAQHREIIEAFRQKNSGAAARLVAENAMFGKEVIISEILGEIALNRHPRENGDPGIPAGACPRLRSGAGMTSLK